MASIYTHHRFGLQLVSRLSEPYQRIVQHNPTLYLLGQQGPDIFFFILSTYHDPDAPGTVIHNQSGKSFIDKVAPIILEKGKISVESSYFLGCICHFLLDATIHPLVDGFEDVPIYNHSDIETELDRYALSLDGIEPTRMNLSRLLPKDRRIPKRIYPVYSGYPDISEDLIAKGIRGFALFKTLLYAPNRVREQLLHLVLKWLGVGTDITGHVMRQKPFARAKLSNPPLIERIEVLMEQAPALIENAYDYIFNDVPLKDIYMKNFNGVPVEPTGE
jgi:hypothetical protein